MHFKVRNSILIIVCILVTVLITGCKKKIVPEYQGMTISETVPMLTNYDNDLGGSLKKLANEENPFGNDAQTIEDKLIEYLTIPETTEIDFYPMPNMEFYIVIKLSNPSKFSISSFTLNGETYAAKDLEEGSDHENLILSMSGIDAEGISSYLVDDIMYNDGKKTKEVEYNGDKIANLGIKFTDKPSSAVVNRKIEATSFSCVVNVNDSKYAISKTGKILKAVLYDGEDIIRDINLNIGKNQVNFDKLHVDSLYQMAIVACYDLVDGEGMRLAFLDKELMQTKVPVAPKNIVVDTESVAFDIDLLYPDNNVAVSGIEIYKGEALIESLTELSNPQFDNLLSDITYTIKILYNYNLDDGTGTHSAFITESVTTVAKEQPIIWFGFASPGKREVNYDLEVEDEDETGVSLVIEVYRNGELVKEVEDFSIGKITGLQSNTKYIFKAKYYYDLNDGSPIRVIEEEFDCYTYAEFYVLDVEILNEEEKIDNFDYLFLKITIDNTDAVTITKFTISGQEIGPSEGSSDSVLILKYRPESRGGVYVARVEEIEYEIESSGFFNKRETVLVDCDKTDEIFVLGSIYVDSIYNEYDNVFGEVDENEIIVKFDNPTGYDIEWIEIEINRNWNFTITNEEFEVIDKETYRLPMTMDKIFDFFVFTISVSSYKYGMPGVPDSTTYCSQRKEHTFYSLAQRESRAISLVDDLININSHYQYHLTNDIDLEGINWEPLEFEGIIHGNGYRIKNLTIVGGKQNQCLGMFSRFKGKIDGLHLEDLMIDVEGDFGQYIGGLVAELVFDSTIMNCTITGEITVYTDDQVIVGGIVGYTEQTIIKNNDINIVFDVRSYGSTTVGGVCGFGYGCEFFQNIVSGSIDSGNEYTEFLYIGGLVGYDVNSDMKANIVSSIFNLYAYAYYNIGGICGKKSHGRIEQCIFDGKIHFAKDQNEVDGYIGGIAGIADQSNIYGNIVNGDINIVSGDGLYAGGIIGKVYEVDVLYNVYSGRMSIFHYLEEEGEMFYSSITTEGYYDDDIEYNENYILYECSVKYFSIETEKVGTVIYVNYLDDVNFYLDTLYWDRNIWDFAHIDFYNGKYPVFK